MRFSLSLKFLHDDNFAECVSNNYTYCDDGKEICMENLCDGVQQCASGWDELGCYEDGSLSGFKNSASQ